MKGKSLSYLFVCLILASLQSNAESAGTLVYHPDSAFISVPAGSQGTTALSVEVVNSNASTSSLTFLSKIADANLPIEWISASPGSVFISKGTSATTTLTVTVPPETPAGLYGGRLASYARTVHGIVDQGTGFLLSINVPPACSGTGTVQIDSFGPSVLWPPDHSLQAVTVKGSLLLPAGCSVIEAAYRIDDEYGIYTWTDNFTVTADDRFTIVLPLEAWREGQDKDGRRYTILFSIRNEAGVGSSEALQVLVPHDMRKLREGSL